LRTLLEEALGPEGCSSKSFGCTGSRGEDTCCY